MSYKQKGKKVNDDGLLKITNANACIECGKCTGNCPVSRFNTAFSPRKLLSILLSGGSSDLLQNDQIWSCLTCGMCRVRCPMAVNYTELTRALRVEAFNAGKEVNCAHGGALQSMMKIMTSDNLSQNRMEWISDDFEISDRGDTLYFVGCAPYFDTFFNDLNIDTLAIAKSTIHILNALNVKPVLLKNEKCCGHDLLWAGDNEGFKKLARYNLNEINKLKPKKIVFSCAECYRTFKLDYQLYIEPLDFEMVHISEVMADKISGDGLRFGEMSANATYHDACRLGRHMGIYESPRKVLASIPGLNFIEMPKHKEGAICCGTNLWINCNSYSRMIQTYRLGMGRQTGADVMLTTCPKCYIHFTCAMQGEHFPDEAKIEVKDLAVLAAEALE